MSQTEQLFQQQHIKQHFSRAAASYLVAAALQKEVEDRLSEALLAGQVHLGDRVTIGAKKGIITLFVREPKEKKVLQEV